MSATDPSHAIAAVAAAAAHQSANDVDAAHHLAVAESLAHHQQQQQQHQQQYQQYQQYQQVPQHEADLSGVNDLTHDATGALQQMSGVSSAGSLMMKQNMPVIPNKCRRCKKKRPDDEPMETARYRTCKPCREIERKKKRVKKANLRGETLPDFETAATQQITSQHLPQQSLQHLATNADVERDLIQIANQVSNSSALQAQMQYLPQDQQQLQQQYHQQQYHHTQQPDEKEIPIDDSLLGQGVDSESHLTSHDDSKKDLASDAHAEAIHIHGSSVVDPSLTEDMSSVTSGGVEEERRCLYCNEIRTINDNGRYQLCESCVVDPLRKDNVFDDYELYSQKIFKNRTEDLRNCILICKFQPNDGIITDFNPAQPNLDPIITDLNEKFVNPLIAKSGYKFSKGSSNLAAKPYPKTIKLLFKCKQDIKTVQKQSNSPSNSNRKMKTENCHSTVYISYDLFGKSLSIKFNHLAHLTFLEKTYSRRLIDKVSAWMMAQHDKEQMAGANPIEESQEQVTERLLYKVFNQLKDATRSDLDDNDALIAEVGALKKINFIKDFLNA
ncbi:hypothetical protein WICPIJ_008081 [Wickerhamomyces pijperi]|uniref:Uncharacterized protein n=1 Tax=Wickerhamomyces pijperi TaxID=599730 RepID=A0A9P8TIK0_WICPI|nr:hypothetical protein WICPIJ_008081 [Wickerhamomyces pijperi]